MHESSAVKAQRKLRVEQATKSPTDFPNSPKCPKVGESRGMEELAHCAEEIEQENECNCSIREHPTRRPFVRPWRRQATLKPTGEAIKTRLAASFFIPKMAQEAE